MMLPWQWPDQKVCLNVNGLDVVGGMDELKLLLVQQPFDFIAINETKLDNSWEDEDIELSGYKVKRYD